MPKPAQFNPKPGVAEMIAPGLRRILAPNPSPMTFRGTNTYLLGTREIAVIDPGPPDQAHLTAILDALEAHQRISHIFVTHSHIDHSPLAMVLAQLTDTKVHGFGPSKAGRSPVMQSLSDLGGGEGIDETFMPDVTLVHGMTVHGAGWSLKALHTPGHMGNHLCYAWPESSALFSGDLVMGWATSMVSPPDGDLTAFMASLDLLASRSEDQVYYPGHGAPIKDPAHRVGELAAHRKSREGQILDALQKHPGYVPDLTAAIYTDVDPALLPAAERNVLAHLIDLAARNVVKADGNVARDARFSLA
ncbi:MBL fold metallo-hydrolase [Litoreibacter roseus]|uniref:MBL fold hydrolase n=1 Tax=Litoreibacter roseus TaxID=2601869 RepID=A0A6N6JFF7_9RHOB|nr:MBL fold metallo-hydrolase [Litoreibacter roseus]GFE64109.1 MBL fold hydrolase [Litoreibacter roseus]